MDDAETLHRRARLRELINTCFGGKDVYLLNHIEKRTGKRPNQGEISAIQKDNGSKSFGDKKAKVLTEQIGLDRFWFAKPLGSELSVSPQLGVLVSPRVEQPFISYNQLSSDEQELVIAWRNCNHDQREMFRLLVDQVAKNATKAA